MLAFGVIWNEWKETPSYHESKRRSRSEIEDIAHVATTCLKIRDSIDVAQSFVSGWKRDNPEEGNQ